MKNGVDTVFFDVGNTLLFPNRDVILAPLRERAPDPSLELWHAIERRTKQEFDAEMKEGRADHGFWYLFYTHLLEELRIEDEKLRSRLVAATQVSANWGNLVEGTREILNRIGSRYKIGVISNADGKIEALLSTNGIADCFRTITDSGLVGYEKPHPAIFAAALEQMKVEAQQCLYVGDVYSVDYVGATRAGMRATIFDVAGAYRENGLQRVQSLKELEGWLLR
ncbi:MAG TPA: HAD family hydrolase [Terriglobales bacterium]|nr:HAD family hydrolase [Terriglobales bacterium]